MISERPIALARENRGARSIHVRGGDVQFAIAVEISNGN